MFSIQVLARALEVWGLAPVNLNHPDAAAAKADPTTQAAFICNLREHWWAGGLCRVGGPCRVGASAAFGKRGAPWAGAGGGRGRGQGKQHRM